MTTKIKRDTTIDLFTEVLKLVKENGHFKKAESIMDFYLPNEKSISMLYKPIQITNYRFDFVTKVNHGTCEGIFLDVRIEGAYTETPNDGEVWRTIGTFKTLRDDLEAMQIMGELSGVLIHYSRIYINQNIDRYTPIAELNARKEYTQK